MKALNLNTILVILGGLGIFAPDVASVAAWLASTNVAWLAWPIRILGFAATFFAAAPLVVPRLRAFLALLGLATAPGAAAPWDPKRDLPPSNSAIVIPTGMMRGQPNDVTGVFTPDSTEAKTPKLTPKQ